MGKDRFNIHDKAACQVVRGGVLLNSDGLAKQGEDKIPFIGKFRTEHWRKGKLIDVREILNDLTTVGKNAILNTYFNELTQIVTANWCTGLINNASFTGYNIADTMASHGGWTEWTAYTQTTRVAWTQGTAASAAITNSSPMVFDINGTGDIRGLFVTTVNTKGGTTGVLWSAASYTSVVSVIPGDQIRSTYSLSC